MSETRNLLSFPLELLQEISSHLHPQDIKAFRATSRVVHAAASPYLIPRAYLALRPGTIAVFNQIIAHPIFGKNIQEIVFDASQFLRPERHQNIVGHREDEGDGLCRHKKDRRCNPEYERLYKSQEKLKSNLDDFLENLKTAALVCCRLDSLVYWDWRWICDMAESRWYVEKGPMSWDLDSNTVCLPRVPGYAAVPSSVPLDQLLRVLCSVSIRNLSVDCNTIDRLPYGIDHVEINRLFSNTTDLHLPLRSCKDVQTFKAAVLGLFKDFVKGPLSYSANLGSLVASFSNLRHLELSYEIVGATLAIEQRQKLISQVFPLRDCHWPFLRSLYLDGYRSRWDVDGSCLWQFLLRHEATLRHLKFAGLHIHGDDDNWKVFVDRMHRWLSLDSADLSNLQDYCLFPLLPLQDYPGGMKAVDVRYRRLHLDVMEQWVIQKEPYGLETDELKQKFEEVCIGWHKYSAMEAMNALDGFPNS